LSLFAGDSRKEHDVARIQIVCHSRLPNAIPVNPNGLWRLPHGSQSLHVLQSLHNDGSLEEKEHSEVEQAIIPVLVEEPEKRAKQLEYEEWGDHMLLVEV